MSENTSPGQPGGWAVIAAWLLGLPTAGLAFLWIMAPLGLGFAPVEATALAVFLFSWMIALPVFVLSQLASLILSATRWRRYAPRLSLAASILFLVSVAVFLLVPPQALTTQYGDGTIGTNKEDRALILLFQPEAKTDRGQGEQN